MREHRTGAAGQHQADEPTPAGSPQPAANIAATRTRLPDAEAGVQRLLDAWGQATLAERNAFLWLAAEEIQAAQEGEFQNALTTPEAQGNGPTFRLQDDLSARDRVSSADLAAADIVGLAVGAADGAKNIGVVDATKPAGGPRFDRSRPQRGDGRGE